jgi:hypothetical protein
MKFPADKTPGRSRRGRLLSLPGCLVILTCTVDAGDTLIYKSIAADGTTVFTDQPAPSAKLIKPPPLNVMDSPGDSTPAGTNDSTAPAGTSNNTTPAGTHDTATGGSSGALATGEASATSAATTVTDTTGSKMAGISPVIMPELDDAGEPERTVTGNSDASAGTAANKDADAEAGADAEHTRVAPTSVTTTSATTASAKPDTVNSVSILAPQDRQTLTDPAAPLWVEIATAPAPSLPRNMTALVRLDDVLVVTGNSARLPMDVPERGAHWLQVKIVDQSGVVVAESAMIEIYVKQRVVQSKN